MTIIAVITAALKAFSAWCETAAIRERRELRTEARSLRHEILKAADAGNTRLLGELQDALTDNQRDSEALFNASGYSSVKGR